MATYKKRGAKKSISSSKENDIAVESTTAEVFEALDSSASKTEEWVVKYQNIILTIIGVVAIGVLGYLGYNNFVVEPKQREAVSELNQAQYYFELAVNSVDSDSLYSRALRGGEGKYGFLDIIENYKGTPAAKLATIPRSQASAYDSTANFREATEGGHRSSKTARKAASPATVQSEARTPPTESQRCEWPAAG